jgi:hypothetical protein
MKSKTGTYGEYIRDINTYIGNLLPLQSEDELDQYGTQIEPVYGELVPYTAPAAASTTNPYLPLQSETELDQYGTHIGSMYGKRGGGSNKIKKSHKSRLHKRKSHKRKSHKRKSHKRK